MFLKVLFCLAILVCVCAPVLAQKPFGISSEYDKFKDRTLVSSDYMRVYGSEWNRNPLELSIQFTFEGRSARKPGGVLFYFWSATPRWRFEEPPALLAIVDQDRVILGQAGAIERDIHADRYSVSAREYVPVIVPIELFEKLVKASSVEMQIGNAEFRLTDRHIATMRAIHSRMSAK